MDYLATPITGFPPEMWEKICEENQANLDNFNKGSGRLSGGVEEFTKAINAHGARILYFGDKIPLPKINA